MENNKSDTLSQRKKAQQEFLELKRMQSGELVPETETIEVRPKTFKEKVTNFWFHYKVHTILIAFAAVVLAFGITQCANKEHYDGRVVLYINRVCSDAEADIYKDYLTPYFSDTNGDGIVNLQIINCAYTMEGSFDMNYTSALSSKLQSVISDEPDVQLFIVDDTKINQLNNISSDFDSFFVETIDFPEDIYTIAEEQEFNVTKNLKIARRVVSGTMIEKDENIETYVKQAQDVLDKLTNK